MVTSSLLLAMSGSSAAGLGAAQSSSTVLQGRLGCLRSDERSGAWGNNHGQLIKNFRKHLLEIIGCHHLCEVSTLKGKNEERKRAGGGFGGLLSIQSESREVDVGPGYFISIVPI